MFQTLLFCNTFDGATLGWLNVRIYGLLG
jgi:hypothetical protein